MSRADESQLVAVVCSLCHTRMYARRDQIGREIECPDCGRGNLVKPPPKKVEPKREDPGEYGIRGDDVKLPAAEPALVLVVCRQCGTRMHARAEHAGRKVACPDCKTVNVVPKAAAPQAPRKAPALVKGDYQVDATKPAERPTPKLLLTPRAVEEREETPEPPRWPLFSGIYSFPWRADVIGRWTLTTLGLLATNGVAWFAFAGLFSGGDARSAVTGAGALSTVVFFFSLWTFSFAAACLLVVVEETAEGADKIDGWPGSDWREWIFKLLYVLQVGFLAVMAGYLVSWGVEYATGDAQAAWIVYGVVAFLAFPFLLLSALESDSAITPVSLPIIASLFRLPHCWLGFYAQMALGLGLIIVAAAVGAPMLGGGIALALSPFVAAYLFIGARLVGRLGWVIVDRLGQREPSADLGQEQVSSS